MQSFSFLGEHIVRIHGSPCVSLKSKLSLKPSATARKLPPVREEDETTTEDEDNDA